MRNLKKILALVLALVMSLSLMATAGAESFKDVTDDNPYKTAIDVLTELKVVKGYGDGNFQPDGQLNRAEAAVLVYRIATGDVEDKYLDNYTFMQQSKFTDLDGYNWAKGYINYCQNAGIVVGTDATHFNPGGKVTGYQLLVMLLRTLGYGKAGEFADPKGWELQTAAIAEREGITANVTTGDFGAPAPRAMVAELLFRGLLTETVTYSALVSGGYTKGETLGMREFKLEELEGVVVANEFANLYGTSVLANGKTNLEIAKDDVRSLDVSTELTDMGERQHVYITGSKVLSMDNEGLNTVKENDGAAVVIDTAAKFQAVAGMPAAADIEYFVNFDRVGQYTCDQRLEFRVTFQDARAMASFDVYAGVDISAVAAADNLDDTLDNNWTVSTNVNLTTLVGNDNATNLTTAAAPLVPGNLDAIAEDYIFNTNEWPVSFKKVIRAGNDISDADLAVIRGIFGAADNSILVNSGSTSQWAKDQITGDVFVGTKSTNNTITDEERDLSNTIGYNKFFEEYINAEVYDINWDRADNGEWAKFIDNDGDGRVDYAFLTQSNMDEVLSTYTKGDATVTEYYTFSDDADNWYSVRYLGDTPAVGDVVLYSLIDGQILVEDAATETVTVTDYSWKDDQIITDKGTYGQSGIENWTEMMELISAMKDNTQYAVYFDHFGFVRAYEIPGGTTYALVTEIYARNNANGNLVQEWPMNVELVVKDADATEYNLVNGGKNIFVATTPWAQIQNLAAVGNYYNWLQPAIEHLGVTRTGLGATKVSPNFKGEWNDISTFWPSNRQIIRNIASIPAAANGSTNTFNYGPQTYGSTTLNADGTIASWNQEQGASASFTNVAVVNINDNNATLEGAAQVRTDNRNNVLTWPNSGKARYAVDYIQLSTKDVVKGQARYDIYNTGTYAADNNYYVNAVDTTEYYIVYNDDVLYFQGYANMPKLTMADNRIHAAYAVARDTSADNSGLPYWVADVIVYEVQSYAAPGTSGISLAYYNPNRNTSEIQYLDTLSDKATPADVDLVPKNLSWNADGGQFNAYSGYGFYKLTNPSAVEDGKMTATGLSPIVNTEDAAGNLTSRNFNKNGIFAGTIIRVYVLAGSSYIDINTSGLGQDGTNVITATNPLRTDVSLKLDNNIYSITEQVVNEGTWNQIVRNVANTLRYDGRQGFVANSQVKPNDRVIWVGQAPTNGTVGSSNFIVDLGNDITAGDDANAGLHYITPDWLFNRTNAVDGVVGEINEVAHGDGLWADIMKEQANPAVAAYGLPTVSFFNKTENYTTLADSISYANAVASGKPTVTVKFDKDNAAIANVTVNGTQATKQDDGLTWIFDETIPTSTKTYTLAVTYQNGKDNSVATTTWNLTVETANTGARFEQDAANGPVTAANTITLPTADPYPTILSFLQSFQLSNGDSKEADGTTADVADTDDSAGAKVEWTIKVQDIDTLITGTGVGTAIKLSTNAYNTTSSNTLDYVAATVTSEDGKTQTIYKSARTPGSYGTFTVDVGTGIYVFDDGAGNTWNGVNVSGTQSTDFTGGTAGKIDGTVGTSKTYMLVADNAEGTWAVTGAATIISKGVQNNMSWARVTFSGTAGVTFTAPAVSSILNVVYGGGLNTTGATPTAAQVMRITNPAKVGQDIEIEVDFDANTHFASFTWTNGTKSGEVEWVSGGWYKISATDTATMDTSKPVILTATVAADFADLTITNNSSAILTVTYFKKGSPNAPQTAIVYPVASGTAAVNMPSTGELDTRGPITITASAAVDLTVTGTASTSNKDNVQYWENNELTGDVTITVADPS